MAKKSKKTKKSGKEVAKNIIDIATGAKQPPIRKVGEATPKKSK